MLPGVAWRYSKNVRAMEQTRNRVNRAAANEILGGGGGFSGIYRFLENLNNCLAGMGYICQVWGSQDSGN